MFPPSVSLHMVYYRLIQSPRCWNAVFSEYLKSLEFEQNANADNLTIVAVYVDDLIVIANTATEMTRAKGF